MKYRKKPVTIEAMQWDGTQAGANTIIAWAAQHPVESGVIAVPNVGQSGRLIVHTIEGTMHASEGDWIIRGVQGEFYPCKPDIFAKTYEAVAE